MEFEVCANLHNLAFERVLVKQEEREQISPEGLDMAVSAIQDQRQDQIILWWNHDTPMVVPGPTLLSH